MLFECFGLFVEMEKGSADQRIRERGFADTALAAGF